MTNFRMNTGDGKFENVTIDLLIDILASNYDIKHRLDIIYGDSYDFDSIDNRPLIIEYLQEKFGELPSGIKDFLRNEGIDPDDKK